ncbi:MAG: immunity 7 family protein [Bifidobacteriaceae bacterium]|jgi:hypothetical protein|nr:immunity 7 family protein [Bifidobacteriaceae bacterium]
MYTVGWAEIIQTPQDEDELPGYVDRTAEILGQLRAAIAQRWGEPARELPFFHSAGQPGDTSQAVWQNEAVTLGWFNGVAMFQICVCHNHFRNSGQDVVELFREIGRIAPGARGLLYILDEEGQGGPANEYCVYVLARGQLVRRRDPFLSPVVPVTEDP